ncbi:enoyl-CoA hydratase family protein [Streptomyces sp. CBMA29]|uniref:enoyl-CoA hydratase family protein n=1 Tax=Streptomyces sp. CBMA29 TaxID=1896314 RepID=UPI001661B1DB|nr:enoyl-CoA hydratase family protein [Streptomyces sp. CBMA29]MBD0735606.1 enoyl-CoA hydratase [Streptomyces sp. CBMA29]
MTQLVRHVVRDQVATITLDSPHNRNALSSRLVAELTEALEASGADADVRAVVLTHTGRTFCAGADLSEAGGGSMTAATQAIVSLLGLIVELPKPVIARVTGHVRAGGMGIVGACDIAVADEGASFAFTEARIGVTPAIISLCTLDVMEPRAGARYYLTGETFDAERAAQIGLLTSATPADGIDAVVTRFTAAVRETSPQGSAETKKLLTADRRRRIAADASDLTALSARLFASEEAREGIRAFMERRPPRWRAAG